MRRRNVAAALAAMLVAALALSGCSLMDWLAPGAKPKAEERAATPAPANDGSGAQGTGEAGGGAETAKPGQPVPAASLFPAADRQVIFEVTDRGQEPYRVTEELIRDGDRVIATYNGSPYIRWVLNDGGVWRVDPRGGGALLRYLPATLTGSETWKQTSGDAEVWFRLRETEGRCVIPGEPAPAECWELTVLNRGEMTVFRFASGIGPVEALAENWADPALSFIKKALETRPGALAEETRTTYLNHPFPAGAESPVVPVTAGDFEAAVAHMRGDS